jgi:hypothetical protein
VSQDTDEARLAIDREKLELDRARLELEQQRTGLETKKFEFEKHKIKLEDFKVDLDRFKAEREAEKPMIEAGLRFAEMAIRSLLILNGGAALGALTFAGNATRLGEAIGNGWLANLIFWLGIGAALSVATAFFSYVSQILLIEGKLGIGKKIGAILRVFTACVGIAAWFIFLHAMISASASLAKVTAQPSRPAVKLLVAPQNMSPIPRLGDR